LIYLGKDDPMKKIFLLLILATICLQSQAQIKRNSSGASKENAIKLNISSLLFTHFSFQYERVLGAKTTALLGVRYRPNISMAGLTTAMNNGNTNGEEIAISNFKYSSLALTPEFRYYTKEAMRGFYIAGYLRYRNTPYEFTFKFRDDNNLLQTYSVPGKLNAFTGGAMIGTNIFLSDNMNLDLFIIGGHVGTNSFSLRAESPEPLTAAEQQDLRESLTSGQNDIGFFNSEFNYEVDANGVTTSTNFFTLGFRGIGLNLVYKF
jgi:hypothetical protein